MSSKSFLSVQDVATRFGVNPVTIYRMAKRGKIPALKIGNQWRFSESMLDEWVADRMTVIQLKAMRVKDGH